jgi:hypothetical protein
MGLGVKPVSAILRVIRADMLALGLGLCLGLSTGAFAQSETLQALPFAKKAKLAKAGDNDARFAVAEALEKGIDVKIDLFQAAR